jgi:serine/threonine protein kinase
VPLSAGSRLGPYEILAPLGAGGMGEVYRATDTKLNRAVALKILSPALATDADYMARFTREAQVLASLNHPNIAAIYGLEESDGVRALVMELVEGATLAERIAAGSLPLEETLHIAKQIADALEAAHEKGIVHRDLKPANVKITPEGVVKVLDFGLAKVPEQSAPISASSPTLTMRATQAGVIMGTAAYMSPEQAAAKPVDKRADIWSFGVVLWEMLTGRELFSGETISHTLADVLRAEIDVRKLPAGTPAAVRELVRRCLDRDTKTRLRDIGEARIAIQKYLANPVDDAVPPPPAATKRRSWLRWAIAGPLVALAIVGPRWWPASHPVEQPLLRLDLNLGPDVKLEQERSSPILSPDGTKLVYAALGPDSKLHLWVRRLDQPSPVMLAGTEDAFGPFFSPDGRSVGFFADGKLKKIGIAGGAPVTLCDAPSGAGGSWSEDGSVAFVHSRVIFRIPSAGGTPIPLTQLDNAKYGRHRWPQFLPGGKALLFTANNQATYFDTAAIELLSLPDGRRKTIHQGATFARYLPSGHIVFVDKGTLFALPFDLRRLEITGALFPILEEVVYSSISGNAQFDVSRNGTVVYLKGKPDTGESTVQWLDASGGLQPLLAKPGNYKDPFFSPDGTRLALGARDGGSEDTWIYDWKRDTMTRLTFGPGRAIHAIWFPDGRHLVYLGDDGLFWMRADGSGKPQRLTQTSGGDLPTSFTPDGKWLTAGRSIWPVQGDPEQWRLGNPEPVHHTQAGYAYAAFSPDGHWLAYASTESGRSEIYVRAFPGAGGKWQISNAGGVMPVWSRAGRELFFRTVDESRIMVTEYQTKGDSFMPGRPRLWSETAFTSLSMIPNFALAPDDKRFAVVMATKKGDEKPNNELTVLLNFFTEIRRRSAIGAQ